MAQEITLTLSVVQSYHNQLTSALSNMEIELVNFLSKQHVSNICIQDKFYDTGLVVCLRKVERTINEHPLQTCLDVCTVSMNSPFNKMGAIVNIIKITQKRNPYNLLYLHQVTNKALNGFLLNIGFVADKAFNYYLSANPAGVSSAA